MSLSSTVAWTDHKAFLLSGIRGLFDGGRLSDLEIRCRSKVFKVHKLILSLFTDYFKHCDGLWANIDVEEHLMESVLKFLYYGQVTVNYDQMEGFLSTCKFLGIRLFKSSDINAEGMTEDEAALSFQERYELNDFQLMCHRCYRCFPNEKAMKKHNWNCGRQQTMFKCKCCEKVFAFKMELKNHEKVHGRIVDGGSNGESPFRCPLGGDCREAFRLKSEVWHHVTTVHDRYRYKCPPCNLNFKYASELGDHNATMHGDIRTFPCKECKEVFSSQVLLRVHRKKSHWTRKPRKPGETAVTAKRTTVVQQKKGNKGKRKPGIVQEEDIVLTAAAGSLKDENGGIGGSASDGTDQEYVVIGGEL